MAAFSREVALKKGDVRRDLTEAIYQFATRANVSWSVFDTFLADAINPEISGEAFVQDSLPWAVRRVAAILHDVPDPLPSIGRLLASHAQKWGRFWAVLAVIAGLVLAALALL